MTVHAIATSLRVLFLRRMLGVLLPSLLIGSGLSYFYTARSILDSYDLNLLDDATDLMHQVKLQTNGTLLLDLPLVASQMLTAHNEDAVVYAVWNEKLELLSGTRELFLEVTGSTLESIPIFKNLNIKGKRYRAILLPSTISDQKFYISVAQTTNAIDHLLANVLLGFLLLGGLLIVVACIGVVLGVKRSLIPIEALRTAIATRAPHDFQPLPEHNVPSELQPIIHGVNELLVNLEKSVLSHRRFVADAAHQLRTPLAILHSKLEVSLANPPSAPADTAALLKGLLATTGRASHLASQLLSLSRIENTEMILPVFKAVDLSLVLRDAAADFVMKAEKNQVELEFNLQACQINGNALLLQELFSNLLDNAIKYAGSNTLVKVELRNDSQEAQIVIADNGVGVPDTLLEKLGSPFFRNQPQDSEGCGLGLAIATEIVLVHKGTIKFKLTENSKGLCVYIGFPLLHSPH